MKKQAIAGLSALILMNSAVYSADLRDAAFDATSKTSKVTMKTTGKAFEATRDFADLTAEEIKELISSSVDATVDTSKAIGKLVVDISEFSAPAFKLTGKGIALVFKSMGATTQGTFNASKQIVILVQPTSKVTAETLFKVLGKLSEGTSEASRISSIVLEKITKFVGKNVEISAEAFSKIVNILYKNVAKPSTEISQSVVKEILKVISKGSEASTDVAVAIIKKYQKQLEATSRVSKSVTKELLEISSEGTEATSKASANLMKLASKGTDATSELAADLLRLIYKGTVSASEIVEYIVNKYEKQLASTTNASSEIIEFLFKYLVQEPLELSTKATVELSKLAYKGSKFSYQATDKIVGFDNIQKGFELTGKGISLTSEGIANLFYLMTRGTSAISNLFDLFHDEVEEAIENEDQDTLEGVRDMIRTTIVKTYENGEELSKTLGDEELDALRDIQLTLKKRKK